MRALRKYVLVTVSSKVNASLSSSTTRGLTGCTSDSQFSFGRGAGLGAGVALGRALGSDRAMLAHEVAEGTDAVAAGAAGPGLPGDVGDAPGAICDGLEDVAVGHHVAVAHVHGGLPHRECEHGPSPRGRTLGTGGRLALPVRTVPVVVGDD